MNNKKTTVNITSNNHMKILQIQQKTGFSQSEIINQAISDIPIIILGNQKELAKCFFDIRRELTNNHNENVQKEVSEVCQLLNSLMDEIAELKP